MIIDTGWHEKVGYESRATSHQLRATSSCQKLTTGD